MRIRLQNAGKWGKGWLKRNGKQYVVGSALSLASPAEIVISSPGIVRWTGEELNDRIPVPEQCETEQRPGRSGDCNRSFFECGPAGIGGCSCGGIAGLRWQ